MPDNTNVNNNSAVVVVGRTAPVPPGQQKAEKSIPVVIASDQTAIPVAEQNKVQSEVALSLLGIPRSEVALGIFADVNTYDVNPTEWTSTPEQYATVAPPEGVTGIGTFGWGLTHVPEESGALVEAPPDKSAILTSKRFFRYQPGRVSSATFGVKTTTIDDNGATVQNPSVRKYGIFDNYDGYYWETRNNGLGDNFAVVRRTQAVIFENPVEFNNGQTSDYGTTNPYDPLEARASESVGAGASSKQYTGYTNAKLGDLVILRDNLVMTHAGCYDHSLLQEEHQVGITSVFDGSVISMAGLAKSITDATYNISTGLMTVTTGEDHEFKRGKFITLTGIAMTCYLDPVNPKIYPNRTHGYNIVRVDSPTQFTVNVGVSTVQTFYVSGGHAVGLSTGQYVSYSKGPNAAASGGFTDDKIYQVKSVGVNTTTGISTVTLDNLNGTAVTGLTNFTGISSHVLITPVPFVQPVASSLIGSKTKYTTVKPDGMFPYQYEDADGNTEGYIKTERPVGESATLKSEIDAVNNFYDKWVNQNVHIDYLGVYEYRVPRSRFSGDRLDGATDELLYSDVVSDKRAGQNVLDADTLEQLTDTSIWDLEFDKVTMYKVEFSWYGAVGALFLAYVPVSNGEARWVRVHHLRASNQLKVSSLGNATLPITYMVYGGGSAARYGYTNDKRTASQFSYGTASEHIVKYGASYYIDGGDRGTVKLFSYGTPTEVEVYGLKRTEYVGTGSTQVDFTNSTSSADPYLIAGASSGLTTSYYTGAKIVDTGDPLDQNIEISYIDRTNNRLYLNSPLNSIPSSGSAFKLIPNRVTPLIGIKCRDFIQSSTGRDVRNRTQVYPTRMSTGSNQVVKVDLLKSPIFQTTSVIVEKNTNISISAEANIGKRGKPTKVQLPLSTYTGAHTYVESASTKTAAIKVVSDSSLKNIASGGSAVSYNSTTGVITMTLSAAHGISPGETIRVLKESLAFTCSLDNYGSTHKYPRTTDPIFDGNGNDGSTFSGAIDGNYSRPVTALTGTTGSTLVFSVTSATIAAGNNPTNTPSAAEYIRDIGGGAYGYFRGYFEDDASQRKFSVLGYLENRGSNRTKNIETDGYYFYALESTNSNIVLSTTEPFLREDDSTPTGGSTSSYSAEFTLDQLSSIKVNPQVRSPIPKTGTVVASLFIPGSGEEYDLSPYFDYNKEYLSFPLTNKVESLYLCASTQQNYVAGSPFANVSASLTWEEQ